MGNAQRESERIRKEAEERSGQIKDGIIRNASEEAEAVMEQARISGEESEREAEAVIRAMQKNLKLPPARKKERQWRW